MAEPVMENPFSLPPASRKIMPSSKTVQDIQDCIKEMTHDMKESGLPINEDSEILQRFCVKLEYLLQVAQKPRTGVFGRKKDYWNYFHDCLASNKSLNDGIRFVKSLPEFMRSYSANLSLQLRTSLGRGRAFIRFSLMHHRLADSIQQCVTCGKITSEWFHPKAVWLNHTLSSSLISAVYDLNGVQFDLSPGGYDLDSSWPTFARKTFGTSYTWAPPSRSASISSLASVVTQDGLPPQSRQIAEENNLSETQVRCDRFEQLFDSTENEKLALEHDMEVLKKRVEQLDKEVEDGQMKIKIYMEENVQLKTKLESKQELWVEKEAILKTRVENADKTIAEMRAANQKAIAGKKKASEDRAANPTATDADLDLSTESEYSSALESELGVVTKELQQKKEVDVKKTQLVALLDRKISQLEQRNTELLAMLGTMTETNDKVDCTNKGLAELKIKLDLNERRRTLLEGANKDLQEMLHSIEEKSQLIARTAKQKLVQYRDDNRRLKEQLEVAGGGDVKMADILKTRDEETNAVKDELAVLKAWLKKIDPDGSQVSALAPAEKK